MDNIITDIEILHKISQPTTIEEVIALDLDKRLRVASMSAWTRGYGLAAIQIGIPLKYAVYMWDGAWKYLLNTEITQSIGRITQMEGCLSIPHQWFPVQRAFEIEYTNDGRKCRAKGVRARIIQHECMHFNGLMLNELKKIVVGK